MCDVSWIHNIEFPFEFAARNWLWQRKSRVFFFSQGIQNNATATGHWDVFIFGYLSIQMSEKLEFVARANLYQWFNDTNYLIKWLAIGEREFECISI